MAVTKLAALRSFPWARWSWNAYITALFDLCSVRTALLFFFFLLLLFRCWGTGMGGV